MSKFVSFRHVADEAMKDISVTEALKGKVLRRCTRRNTVSVAKLAAMAACGVLIFGILNFSGVLRLGNQPNGLDMDGTQGVQDANGTNDVNNNPEADIFSATAELTGLAPEQSDTGILIDPGAMTDRQLATHEEAEKIFGDKFLTPVYIPEGFRLDGIFASGTDEMNADRIILSYIAEERFLTILEEKTPGAEGFLNDEAIDINEVIDINGAKGFLKTGSSDSEVHWFKDGVLYSVSGQITGEEAVKVARSMKLVKQRQ